MLKCRQKRFPECSFILEDMQKYEKHDYYDNILTLKSFGHSENPWKTLELIFKNLKKGGKYYIKDFFVLPRLTFKGKLNLIDWADYFKYSKFTYQQFIKEAEKIGFKLISKEDLEEEINEAKAHEVTVDSYYEYPFPDEPYLEYLGILLQKV
jgi:SAM-dependent methyltransferase